MPGGSGPTNSASNRVPRSGKCSRPCWRRIRRRARPGRRAGPGGGIPATPGILAQAADSRLIGRAAERRDLAEIWDRARLVTLAAPPGGGKTRLAVDAARRADGPVWYVTVAQIPQEQSVAAAFIDVVAPSSQAPDASHGVLAAFADASGLVILDGCDGRTATGLRRARWPTGWPRCAGQLLSQAAPIRADIRQPVSLTELADVAAARRGPGPQPASPTAALPGAGAAYLLAKAAASEMARVVQPSPLAPAVSSPSRRH